MSAAKAISYAQSAGLPSSLKRRAARAPMAMNASANASPNVFSVIGPMSRFGSTCWRLVPSLAEGLGGIEVGAQPHHPALAHPEAVPPQMVEGQAAGRGPADADERHQPARGPAYVLHHEPRDRAEVLEVLAESRTHRVLAAEAPRPRPPRVLDVFDVRVPAVEHADVLRCAHHGERLPRAPGRVQVAHDSTVARKRLQVAQRVHDGPVHAHLEVQVRAEAQAGAADVADDLALRHVLARANGERRLVAIARGE